MRGVGVGGAEKFRRGEQICKAPELRGRASHLIRRRFYSPRWPNPDKLSAIREASPTTTDPPPPPPPPHLLILQEEEESILEPKTKNIYLIKDADGEDDERGEVVWAR